MENDQVPVELNWRGDIMQLELDDLDVHVVVDEDGDARPSSHDGTHPPPLLLQHHTDFHSQPPPNPNPNPNPNQNQNQNASTATRTHSFPSRLAPRGLQTVTPSGQQQSVAPPLLPAFLITGLLLGAIVFIIVWRRLVERRRILLRGGIGAEEEDVWGGAGDGDGMREKPRMWEAFTTHTVSEGGSDSGVKEKWEGWESVMPLSATPFFGSPKKQQPRYLIPSDRPTTFMTRMFGGGTEGYRLHSRSRESPRTPTSTSIGMGFTGGSAGGPLMSTIAYTNRQGMMLGGSHSHSGAAGESGKGVVPSGDESEDRIEKVLLSFVVSMPFERESEEAQKMRKRKSKDNNDEASMQLDELPELCLGSLMIPYG